MNTQHAIIAALQARLLEAVQAGDWSGTDQWNKHLVMACNAIQYLQEGETMASLKEKIDILVQAVSDRNKTIAEKDKTIGELKEYLEHLTSDEETLKTKAADIVDAEAAADKALNDLNLIPVTGAPQPPVTTQVSSPDVGVVAPGAKGVVATPATVVPDPNVSPAAVALPSP